jgi:hypothetical protein
MFLLICIVALLSIFSSSVMMYIALATSIGPWVGPLLVLMISPLLKLFFLESTLFYQVAGVIGGSIGGILATACAFSFPALYFIDSALYNQWLLSPIFFIGVVAMLCFFAGAFGMICAGLFESRFDIVSQGPFPSAHLIFSMLHAVDHAAQRIKLFCGGIAYATFLLVRSVILWLLQATTPLHVLISGATIVPMLVAIGFVTGHVIAMPLFIGVLIRYLFVDIVRSHLFGSSLALTLPFSLAFCTGIIVSGLLISIVKSVQAFFIKRARWSIAKFFETFTKIEIGKKYYCFIGLGLLSVLCCAYYCNISVLLIVYSIIATGIAVYFMVILAAKTGLAYLGRFATFVMIPAMLIFRCSPLQLIILATCVEVAGGVAVDALSGRKIVRLAGFNNNRFIIIQWIGLFIASIATGFVLWALCSYLQLGSAELAGYKAHARALLLGVDHFDMIPFFLGGCVGSVCSFFKINTGTLLGGILMPLETAAGLIAGGAIAFFVNNKDSWYPLAAGIFAANSLYMIIKAVLCS